MEQTKIEYLTLLYGQYDFDFEVCILTRYKKSKWIKFSEAINDEKFLKQVNQRQILDIEIVLDLEEPDRVNLIIESLKKFKFKYKLYKTGGKGYHFHLIFPDLRSLSENRRTELKEHFIQIFDCDLMKKSPRTMISIEGELHRETGKPKELIEEITGWNENTIFHIVDDIKDQKKKKKQQEQKNKTINTALGAFTNLFDMAKKFIKIQPIFYDKNKIWWIWDFSDYCWKIMDDIDLLNRLDESLRESPITLNSVAKNEILDVLRRTARKNIPKEPEKSWIQFKDRIVDVKTGEYFESTPKYHFTNPIPWTIGDSEKTPTLDKLFKEWVIDKNQDSSYVKTLYEIIAYSTLKHQFLQRLFAFSGIGSNGKGCFLSIVTKFLGKSNITTSEMRMLAKNNFEASALYRKQACLLGEVEATDMTNTNLLKKLTGEDLIRYEFKGKTSFSEESFCTIFINTNSLPITPDKSDGFYRRWLLIDFPHQFSTGFDVLASVPDKEFQNLAKKSISYAKQLYLNRKFSNEGSLIERKAKYEAKSNPVEHFVNDYCQEEVNVDTPLSEFYNNFCSYLRSVKLRIIPKKLVSKILRDLGFVVSKKNILREDGTKSSAIVVYDMKIVSTSIDSIQYSNGSLHKETNYKQDTIDTPSYSKDKNHLLSIILEKESGYDKQHFCLKYGKEICDQLLLEGKIFENPKGVLRCV